MILFPGQRVVSKEASVIEVRSSNDDDDFVPLVKRPKVSKMVGVVKLCKCKFIKSVANSRQGFNWTFSYSRIEYKKPTLEGILFGQALQNGVLLLIDNNFWRFLFFSFIVCLISNLFSNSLINSFM